MSEARFPVTRRGMLQGIGAVGGDNLVGRRVGSTRLVCCASPAYLAARGEPKAPEDLARHTCLLYQYAPQRDVWTFADRDGRPRSVRVGGPVHSNSGGFSSALAVAGVGVGGRRALLRRGPRIL